MRTLVLLGWLMVPVVFGRVSLRAGPGKVAAGRSYRAFWPMPTRLAAGEQWPGRLGQVRAGPGAVPAGRIDRCAAHSASQRAKVQMLGHQLPEANAALRELVDQIEDDKSADPKLRDEAREALANAQYYMTWLMRLEGLGAEEWEPEIESARQTYRLLAEQDEARGDPRLRPQASRGSRKRHSPGPDGSRRFARARPAQAMLRTARAGSARSPARSLATSPREKKRKTPARPVRARRRITRALDRVGSFSVRRGRIVMDVRRHLFPLLLGAASVVVAGTAGGQSPPGKTNATAARLFPPCRLRCSPEIPPPVRPTRLRPSSKSICRRSGS